MSGKEREVPIRIVVKKKVHGGGHHGGAWKVAFADFMSAMFCLFLVLWLINQSSDVKAAIAGYFQDPLGRADEFGSSILPGDGAQTQAPRPPLTPSQVLDIRRDRLAKVASQIRYQLEHTPDFGEVKNNIQVELTDEGLRIQLLEDSVGVFFDSGKPVPNPRGEHILALLATQLGALPNVVMIEGYTDARPLSARNGAYTNWELSADRANAARRILTANGLAPEQITQIRGLADRRLLDPWDPYSPRNRRITITMLLTGADPPVADSTGASPLTAGGTP